ncbi:MAG: glycosyltransferase family 87 protein, partial [Vicinamibacterales bacterium]
MISDAALRRVLSDAAVRLWGDVIRALSLTAVLAICAAWLAYYWFSVKTVLLPLNMNDFGKFYYSARLFLDGGNMYGPSAATLIPITETTSRHFWNMNPPHFHVLLLPLAMLGPAPALLVWTAGNLVCLGVSIFLVVRTLHLRAHVFGILWSTLAALSFAATGAIVITGQLTFLLLLPFTVAWVAARQGNWTKAGGYLGLCIAAKPVLLPFLGYLLVKRRWASAGVACAVMAASFMTGIAVFGWQAHKDWLSVLSSVDWPWATMNGSVLGVVTRNLAPGGLYASAAVLPWAIQPLWLSASLAIGLATMWSAM